MNREILRLAIPNIISNISVPLLSTVDTALMGRMSALHIGAVGVGAMIFNFLYWNFGFLRMGTTGITAQAFGKEDAGEILHTLGRAMIIVVVLAAILIIFQGPIGAAGFYLMNVSELQRPLVTEYFYIRIWAAPASLGLYAIMGWFFGMQNVIYPLILTIVINIINILLSFFFIYGLGMEIDGVAYGTVIAQYAGLFLAVYLFFRKYHYLRQQFNQKMLLEVEKLTQFLQINRDIFLRTLCLTFAFGFFYSQSAKLGEGILAANVILLQLVNWMSYGVDGFAFAAESLVGKYKGANNTARLKKSIQLTFVWGMAVALAISMLYWFMGIPILRLFTDQQAVIELAGLYLFWVAILPVFGTPSYLWDGIFIGLTAARAMRNSMLLSLAVYLGMYYYLANDFNNHHLWIMLLVFLVMRALIQLAMYLVKGFDLK